MRLVRRLRLAALASRTVKGGRVPAFTGIVLRNVAIGVVLVHRPEDTLPRDRNAS